MKYDVLTVYDLNPDQMLELKQAYLTQMFDETEERSPSWDELARADEIVDDSLIFDAYANTVFSSEDFMCSAGTEEVTQ